MYVYLYAYNTIHSNIHIYMCIYITYKSIETERKFNEFYDGSEGKESACKAGDPDSIPGSGRSPGEGNGNPLQYSCLKNSMDRGA